MSERVNVPGVGPVDLPEQGDPPGRVLPLPGKDAHDVLEELAERAPAPRGPNRQQRRHPELHREGERRQPTEAELLDDSDLYVGERPMRDPRELQGYRLHLNCGRHRLEGYEGADTLLVEGVDYYLATDVTPWHLVRVENGRTVGDPIPLEDGSCAELYLQGAERAWDLVDLINEAHRVLVADGVLKVAHPYQHSVLAWQDPRTRRAINETTWLWFTPEYRKVNGLEGMGVTASFAILEGGPTSVHPDYQQLEPDPFHRAMRSRVNVVHEMLTTLVKL